MAEETGNFVTLTVEMSLVDDTAFAQAFYEAFGSGGNHYRQLSFPERISNVDRQVLHAELDNIINRINTAMRETRKAMKGAEDEEG